MQIAAHHAKGAEQLITIMEGIKPPNTLAYKAATDNSSSRGTAAAAGPPQALTMMTGATAAAAAALEGYGHSATFTRNRCPRAFGHCGQPRNSIPLHARRTLVGKLWTGPLPLPPPHLASFGGSSSNRSGTIDAQGELERSASILIAIRWNSELDGADSDAKPTDAPIRRQISQSQSIKRCRLARPRPGRADGVDIASRGPDFDSSRSGNRVAAATADPSDAYQVPASLESASSVAVSPSKSVLEHRRRAWESGFAEREFGSSDSSAAGAYSAGTSSTSYGTSVDSDESFSSEAHNLRVATFHRHLRRSAQSPRKSNLRPASRALGGQVTITADSNLISTVSKPSSVGGGPQSFNGSEDHSHFTRAASVAALTMTPAFTTLEGKTYQTGPAVTAPRRPERTLWNPRYYNP